MNRLNLSELATMHPDISITVKVADLASFGRMIATEAVATAQRELRNEDRLVNINEAARMLGCSPRTVYRYVESHVLDAVPHGGKMFFRFSDIQRYIASLFQK